MKRDPYKNQERYISWKKKVKEKGIFEISKVNSDLILAYIRDMEVGRNITLGTKKGPRGFNRLISVRTRLVYLMKKFKEIYNIGDITKVKEEHLHSFFTDMRNEVIKRINGIELTGCNSVIIVPEYNLKIQLKKGVNEVEFTPDKEGTFQWTCGMGMMKGSFLVTESGVANVEQVKAATPKAGGSCGAGGGGCGCGG